MSRTAICALALAATAAILAGAGFGFAALGALTQRVREFDGAWGAETPAAWWESHACAGVYNALAGAPEISLSAAREKAAILCGVSATGVKLAGKTDCAFNFEIGDKFVQVTKRGGHILSYAARRKAAKRGEGGELSAALRAAEQFLQKCAGADFRRITHAVADGVLTADFDGLIKIGVALDSREILFYRAADYLKRDPAQITQAAESRLFFCHNQEGRIFAPLSILSRNPQRHACK